jgi:hypothetical protein
MSNEQLCLAIGIPSVLVVLSWIQQSVRLGRIEATTDRRFESIDQQFTSMRAEMIALRDSIHRDMVSLHERVAVVESKNN